MSFTAEDAISGARVWHPSFDDVTHPQSVAFDWLNSFIRTERRKLQSLVPEMLLSQLTVTLPLSVFSEGASIVGAEQIHTVSALTESGDTTRGDPVALVPLEHFSDPGVWPAASWLGGGINRLYLKGASSDWLDYQALLVNYVAVPTPLTALAEEILLPDSYLDVCIAGLTVFFAMRGGKERVGPQQLSYFMRREEESRAVADTALSAQRAGEVFKIRELF